MSTNKHIQMARKSEAEQQHVIAELNKLAADVERCEKTIAAVMVDLNEVNAKYQGARTTRQDVEYLTILLDCAKKKLAWEKQIASLQKRSPVLLESMMRVLNDPRNPPTEEVKAEMLRCLQVVQNALQRLHPPE